MANKPTAIRKPHGGRYRAEQCYCSRSRRSRWRNPGLPAFTSTPAPGGGQNYSLSLQTLLLLTALSFLPAALLMMTGFTRIIIVLSLLRQALGTQSSPPNQVLVGLALFLTFFVMGPVFDKIYDDAYEPFTDNKITMTQALDKRRRTAEGFHDEADPGGRSGAVRQTLRTPQLNGPGRRAVAGTGAGLCYQRTENRVPDRFHGVHPLSHHRHGGGHRCSCPWA